MCIVLLAVGCDKQKDQVTLVELHHVSAAEAIELITPMIPEGLIVSQDGSRILLAAPSDEIGEILLTLEQIDRPKSSYQLEMRLRRSSNAKHYSTSKQTDFSLNSFRLSEGKEAALTVSETLLYPFFEAPVTMTSHALKVSIKYLSPLNSQLNFSVTTTISGKQHHFESSWITPHNQWQTLSPQNQEATANTFSTRKKNPLDLEIRISPMTSGF